MSRRNKYIHLKQSIIEDYRSGQFTQRELSQIYGLSPVTVKRYLEGIKKPFSHDVLSQRHHVSLDQLKAQGREPGSYRYDPYTMIDNDEPEYTRVVTCPHCPMKFTAHNLLVHLVNVHKRFDLEYLL